MRHSGLRRYTPRENTRFRVVMGGEGESGAYMRVVLAPGLALLGEAAASDSPRHDCGCFSSPPDRLASSGWGVLGLDFSAIAPTMCRCGRSYLTTPFSPFSFRFSFAFSLLFFLASGLQVGRTSACRGAGDDLDGDGRFFLASRLRWGPPAGQLRFFLLGVAFVAVNVGWTRPGDGVLQLFHAIFMCFGTCKWPNRQGKGGIDR